MNDQIRRLDSIKWSNISFVSFNNEEFWKNSIHLTTRSAHKRITHLRSGFTLNNFFIHNGTTADFKAGILTL